MKVLNLNLNLNSISNNEEIKLFSIWDTYLIAGCRTAYKDGLSSRLQIRLDGIYEKIKKAVDDSKEEIELEEAEFDIFKDIFQRGKVDPTFARFGSQIARKIEKIILSSDEKENDKKENS